MITLFAKSGCPYCAKAISALDAHGLSFTKKNIADDAVAEELTALGGKRQVPYLVDGDVAMYESDDIVEYIEKTYGGGAPATPAPEIKIHKAGGACQS
jgi:glutaredoxin